MLIERLVISRGSQIIRDIPFHRGLNLILDAPTRSDDTSGNSVGKSTVLRLIDFCLGSSGEDIWQDQEFKKNNQEILDFLSSGVSVSVELEIISAAGRKHVFWRSFERIGGTKIVATVDERPYEKVVDYLAAVRSILFGAPDLKPSLRQLIPKFIRSSPQKMNRTLMFLGEYTGKADYESIHLFLFGFFDVMVLETRPRLVTRKKRISRDLDALGRLKSEGELQQLIRHVKSEISQKELKISALGESSKFVESIEKIGGIRNQAAAVSRQLAQVTGELTYQKKTIKQLTSSSSKIDKKSIKQMYSEAKAYIPSLHKEFEELEEFVNGLKERKIQYLNSRLPETQLLQAELSAELKALTSLEADAIIPIKKELQSPDLLALRDELRSDYLRLGGLEEAEKSFKQLRAEELQIEIDLAHTQTLLDQGKSRLDANVEIFNKYFSTLSQVLYDETYLLHFDQDKKSGSFKFSIAHVGDNVGTGKKATQTAAFDLAYIQFLEKINLDFPRFALHDGLEAIHHNQLASLLIQASTSSGQLIVATLRDKLPPMSDTFIEDHTVVELSQEDKLFRFI
jgi:uncharacterized protein YydD (DUF2326 family)